MTSLNLVRGCLVIVGRHSGKRGKDSGRNDDVCTEIGDAICFFYCHHVVDSFNHRWVDNSVYNNRIIITSGYPLTSSGQTFPFP